AQDRVSLCRFSFSDGRKCLTPRAPSHPHFCFFHARQESRSRGADKLARDFAYIFSGEYVSANDLTAAIARLFPAVPRGEIKPRAATTLAYLAQTLAQTIPLSQHEYITAFGTSAWGKTIRKTVNQNADHFAPPEPIESTPAPDENEPIPE